MDQAKDENTVDNSHRPSIPTISSGRTSMTLTEKDHPQTPVEAREDGAMPIAMEGCMSLINTRSRRDLESGQEKGDVVIAENRSENDEFLVDWSGRDDPTNPQNWKVLKKCGAACLVAVQTMIVVIYSTSYVSGSPGMMREFGIDSQVLITLGLTTYLLGLAIGPIVLAPLSEIYGRRPVYLTAYLLYFVLVLPTCVAQNFNIILVFRFFAALVGSVTIGNAGGTIADIFDEDGRSLAMCFFAIAPMNGPTLGPIIGGFVYEKLGWRWINWIIFIAAAVSYAISWLLPETYGPAIMRRRSQLKRKETGDDRWHCHFELTEKFWPMMATNLKRPLVMLCTEPICIFWAVYISVIYSILYMCFVAFPIVFTKMRHWSPGISGLGFMGIGVGTFIAIGLDPINKWIYYKHKVDPELGRPPPEARLAALLLASWLTPIGIIWFAWTCAPITIHWIWPILAGIPFGIGNVLIFIQGNNYLMDSYDIYAASALAGNTLARSALGGILPLVTPKMYARLGPNWAMTVLGLLAVALIPIPWGFYKWGKHIRIRSKMLQQLRREKEERERPWQ